MPPSVQVRCDVANEVTDSSSAEVVRSGLKPFSRRGIKALHSNSLRRRKMNGKSLLIASAVAMLFVTGAVNARADQSAGADQVKCVGVNSCKGQGSCKSVQNDCKGHNACKGQGFVPMSAQDCKD